MDSSGRPKVPIGASGAAAEMGDVMADPSVAIAGAAPSVSRSDSLSARGTLLKPMPGDVMPLGDDPLSADQLQAVSDWIAALPPPEESTGNGETTTGGETTGGEHARARTEATRWRRRAGGGHDTPSPGTVGTMPHSAKVRKTSVIPIARMLVRSARPAARPTPSGPPEA